MCHWLSCLCGFSGAEARLCPEKGTQPPYSAEQVMGPRGVITKDTVISLSLLSLKCWKLGFGSSLEAAWTLEAHEMAGSLAVCAFLPPSWCPAADVKGSSGHGHWLLRWRGVLPAPRGERAGPSRLAPDSFLGLPLLCMAAVPISFIDESRSSPSRLLVLPAASESQSEALAPGGMSMLRYNSSPHPNLFVVESHDSYRPLWNISPGLFIFKPPHHHLPHLLPGLLQGSPSPSRTLSHSVPFVSTHTARLLCSSS